MRAIDGLDAHPLADTNGAFFPFWSPDGRSLGLFAHGKLIRVDVATGVVDVICDALNGRGGTWNREDVIVFAPSLTTPLYRVSAHPGSTPSALFSPAAPGGGFRLPTFLRDGRHFVFTEMSPEGALVAIRLGSLDSQTTTVLVPGNKARVDFHGNMTEARVASGYLFFVRAAALVAQRFDERSLRTVGDPSVVVPRVVGEDWGRYQFAVS